jgi:hypothetical protein
MPGACSTICLAWFTLPTYSYGLAHMSGLHVAGAYLTPGTGRVLVGCLPQHCTHALNFIGMHGVFVACMVGSTTHLTATDTPTALGHSAAASCSSGG